MLEDSTRLVDRKQLRRERDRRRGRLGQGRYSNLIKDLVLVIRIAFEVGAIASLWGLEGPLRAGVRADLCRQGWNWGTADLLARDLLEEAHRRVGAKRPDWNEGQPEWTIEAGSLIERATCVRCRKPLPEGRPKFCSDLCKWGHHARIGRLTQATGDRAIRIATRST